MSTELEVMKQALDAFESGRAADRAEAMTALRAALQKPTNSLDTRYFTVVYKDIAPGDEARSLGEHPKMVAMSWSHALHDRDAALITPSRREWVSLTDEEIEAIENEYIVDYRIPAGCAWNFARDIEAKSKEKNSG